MACKIVIGTQRAGSAKIRVAFLIRSLEFGGAERQLVALVTRMDRQRFEPLALCFYPGGEFEQEIKEAGVPLMALGKAGRWDWLRFFIRLVRKLKEIRPHIVHGYLETPNILSVLARPFLPGVRVVFGLRASDMELQHYPWAIRLPYHIQPRLARWADFCIANSDAGKAFWRSKGIPEEKIAVILNGIDTQKFSPNRSGAALLRRRWGIPVGSQVVGAVGRLDPQKGCEVFIEAASILLLEKPEVYLIWVGDGSPAYREELFRLARSFGISERLIWLGARPDVVDVYQTLDVFCSPSSYGEGFPNTLAEAMACGLPCVATAVGDAPLILGDAGFIVRRRDPQALAAALQRLLDLPPEERRQMGARSRARIVENYSMEKMVTATQDALAALVGGSICLAG
ncbi:MAG: glycosyltransferase [Anaerolineae bacterium]|nr:glycosyltransferase [Anaerolineae bacterium]